MISSNKKVVLIKRRFGGKERILVEEFGGQELLDATNEPEVEKCPLGDPECHDENCLDNY